MDPFAQISQHARALSTPPKTPAFRFLWGLALLLVGCLTFSFPALVLDGAAAIVGVCAAYLGSRELFRLFLETLDKEAAALEPELRSHRGLAAALVGALVLMLGVAWFVWRNPAGTPAQAATVLAFNGFTELCDRRVDQVVFAGAHNALSSQDAPGWMFPHHEAGMPQMLQDGIRALLIDVHDGFAGDARIKTDMSAEPNAAMMKRAIGEEGYDAAMRIRDRLVGVDESKHGAYAVAPALREIRDFVVTHPDEVIILIVEDYLTPPRTWPPNSTRPASPG